MENQEVEYLIFFITLIFLMLLIFVMGIIINYYKRNKKYHKELIELQYRKEQEILQAQIEVQEATLSSLAKELHDNIGQLLSTAKMLLGITERNMLSPPDTLKTANATVGQAIIELRSISKSLSNEWLEQFNIIENLTNEVNRLNSSQGISAHLSHVNTILLKSEEQIVLLRIIQEAIQNAVKHANARNIFIDINAQDDTLEISVKDDGKGLVQSGEPVGIGMLNMKQRAKLLGGSIEWQSSAEGCKVLITIPINRH